MKYQHPETLEGLSLESLKALRIAALQEATSLNALSDSEITDEQVNDLTSLSEHIEALSAQEAAITAAATERTAKLAAARGKVELATAEPVIEETEAQAEPVEEASADAEEASADAETVEELASDAEDATDTQEEAVTAAGARRSTVAQAAVNAPAPTAPSDAATFGISLTAAANVTGFTAGQELMDLKEVGAAFLAKSKSFVSTGRAPGRGTPLKNASRYGFGPDAQRFSVAKLHKPANEFDLGDKASAEEQFEVIMAAAREQRLSGGSLVAAGGWCAPSEQIWGFCELETSEGLLSIPEVNARRGGIQFTKGPTLADLLGDPDFGFLQTEAEAEYGTDKSCYVLECPEWEEVRLDAIGFCLTGGLLTRAAYPELFARYVSLAGIGHARRTNAESIDRIRSIIGSDTTVTRVGSTVSDILDALTIQALRIRYTNAMAPNATIEVVLPHWAKELVRSDVSRRTGVDMLAVTDQQIAGWFGVRGLSVQYVYDYQDLTSTSTSNWTTLPTDLEAILYPAGAFVRLGLPVIDLDTVYDSVGLTVNEFTVGFFEEGIAIANTCGGGVRAKLTGLDRYGNTGAANIDAT